jgi:hypothetical protein
MKVFLLKKQQIQRGKKTGEITMTSKIGKLESW